VGLELSASGVAEVNGVRSGLFGLTVGKDADGAGAVGTWSWDTETNALLIEAAAPVSNVDYNFCVYDSFEYTDNVTSPTDGDCWPVIATTSWSLQLDPAGQELDHWASILDAEVSLVIDADSPFYAGYDWTTHVDDINAPIIVRAEGSLRRRVLTNNVREGFDVSEVVGEWGFSFPYPGDQDCLGSNFCGRKVSLQQNGFGSIDDNSIQWSLDINGDIKIFYSGDVSGVISITRLHKYADASGDFFIRVSTADESYTLVSGGVKVDRDSVTNAIGSGE